MVVFFYFQGLNIVQFHAVSFLVKWHLEFMNFLRRLRDRKFSGLDMWDQEEVQPLCNIIVYLFVLWLKALSLSFTSISFHICTTILPCTSLSLFSCRRLRLLRHGLSCQVPLDNWSFAMAPGD